MPVDNCRSPIAEKNARDISRYAFDALSPTPAIRMSDQLAIPREPLAEIAMTSDIPRAMQFAHDAATDGRMSGWHTVSVNSNARGELAPVLCRLNVLDIS